MGSAIDVAESYDIIIIGAGLAGINCAYRLQTQLPDAKFTILEARDTIGGTWELFKYPGIRSDSDLHTYGFAWEPWPYEHPIAEGHLIMSYLHSCVDKYGLGRYMQFKSKVTGSDWDSNRRRWTLTVDHAQGVQRTRTLEASFVVLGTGYYDYDAPLPVVIPGLERFRGDVIHPQFWPTDYDFTDKQVVVIGSGATAITLIPNLAPKTKHVTMLQRSPTYIASTYRLAPFDGLWCSFLLPKKVKAWLNWLYYAIVPYYRVILCQYYPQVAREALLKSMGDQLPASIKIDPHFTPRYKPWEQRVCLSPGGDFFQSLHEKDGEPAKAGVVTANISTVTEDGILCEDGQKLMADVIVTATGLKVQWGGGIPFRVDGEPMNLADHVIWDGCMINDVPNLMYMIGYARASWTVGVDNTAIMLCRLWKDMKRRHKDVAIPAFPKDAGSVGAEDKQCWLGGLTSTYLRNDNSFPFTLEHGRGPWKARGNVWYDWLHARFGSVRKDLALS